MVMGQGEVGKGQEEVVGMDMEVLEEMVSEEMVAGRDLGKENRDKL